MLNEMLGIKYPIIQGGMANIAPGKFAAAVSNAGGLGLIATGGLDAAKLEKEIADPEVAGDFPVMTAKCAELDELKNLLDEKMEEWANG